MQLQNFRVTIIFKIYAISCFIPFSKPLFWGLVGSVFTRLFWKLYTIEKKSKIWGLRPDCFVPNVFLGPKYGKNRSQSPKYMEIFQNHVNIQIALSICFLYLNSSYIHFRVLGTSNFFEIVEPYNSFQFISPVHFQRLFIIFANSSYVYFRVLGDKAPNMEISPQTSKFWKKSFLFR